MANTWKIIFWHTISKKSEKKLKKKEKKIEEKKNKKLEI